MLLIYKKFLNGSDRTMPLSQPPQLPQEKNLDNKSAKVFILYDFRPILINLRQRLILANLLSGTAKSPIARILFLAKAIGRAEAQTARLAIVYLVGWGVSVQFL